MCAHYLPWKMNISIKEPSIRHNFRFVPRHSHNNSWMYQILDPGGYILSIWNRVFLVFCLLALFVDPLYFYLPKVGSAGCMKIDNNLFWCVLVLRSVADLFYMMHMFLKFRTAYILPGSRAIAKGELVMDPHQIAMHYLKSDFIIDFAAMLPLPQIMNWIVIPNSGAKGTENANNTLSLIVFIQYVPRLFLIFPLNRRIIKNTGVVTKTAWAGAAYNLLLYMLASHVLGASWYLMSIQRQRDCWSLECQNELNATVPCLQGYLDCKNVKNEHRRAWLKVTKVIRNCDVTNEDSQFDYGIFADALTSKVVYEDFIEVFLYCLWWGLKNLSSYGQNLSTSRYVPEQAFCILICIGGLILFCHLIGNIQTYLQSLTVRLEEWRVKKRDTEEWMRHRQLPEDLQERVRKFVQYKWLATRGVDEDVILRGLPLDLRRDIQRHLCLALVRRVPFFSQMDNLLLDAICERLVSSLSTEDTYIVREGDPVDEMLFIIRGQLESSTTNGGRSGFFNSIILRPGDFCGEELLTWALVPNPSQNLPTSTRTVKALCEVEAFALRANDLKYVSNQFKLLHSKKLQHVFRYYSHQWRTWGACLIQAAWRRFKKRKLMEELERHESLSYYYPEDEEGMLDVDISGEGTSADTLNQQGQHLGATMLASKFAANTRRGAQKQVKVLAPDEVSRVEMPKLLKPDDPYVSTEGDLG